MEIIEAAVIVTVFNKEKYLKDTLESILSQETGRPFRIILSDDGSTDSSRSICADYAARYVSSSSDSSLNVSVHDITDGKHRGVTGNYLYCLRYALSLNVKYISQIDSDDILADPGFLERQISFLESHPDSQAASSGFFLTDELGTLESVRSHFSQISPAQHPSMGTLYKDLKIDYEYLLKHNNPLVAGGMTYKTDHLADYLDDFASDSDSTQDLPLWLYLSLYGSFWGCDIKSLAYRNLPESVSRSRDVEAQMKFQKASLSTRLRFIDYLKTRTGCNYEALAKASESLYKTKMLRHYAKLSPKDFPSKLWKSLKEKPSLLFSRDLWRSVGVYFKNR